MLKSTFLFTGILWALCAGLALGALVLGQVAHGGVLAYLAQHDTYTVLALLDTDHGIRRDLARIEDIIGMQTWSPDGTRIAYAAETLVSVSPNIQIEYAMNVLDVVGGAARAVSMPRPMLGFAPTWSPDTARMSFVMSVPPRWNPALYVMDIASGAIAEMSDNPASTYTAVWSPDGQWVAFTASYDGFSIYIASADGQTVRRLTEAPETDTSPVWSPDSRSIVFVRGSTRGRTSLYLVDVASGNVRRLTDSQSADFSPAWSPDGRSIAFVSQRDHNAEIYLLDVASGDVRNLTRSPLAEFQPVWSPDGGRIAFLSNRTGNIDIYVMDVASGAAWNLTRDSTFDYSPAWMP